MTGKHVTPIAMVLIPVYRMTFVLYGWMSPPSLRVVVLRT